MMPLFKLGMLFVRTLSKPVAAAIKKRAMDRPGFHKACASFAQWYHRMEINMQVQLMGITARAIKPLEEAAAVKMGAEILGEGVVFAIAASVLLIENRRAAISEARKKQQIQDEFDKQAARLQELEKAFSVLRQDTIDMMTSTAAGGRWTKEQIAKRVLAEKERKEDLKQLTMETPTESWTDTVGRWFSYGQQVATGQVAATEVATSVGKSAFVAMVPTVVSNYVMGPEPESNSKHSRRGG